MSAKPTATPAQQLCAMIDAHKYSPMVTATPLGKVLPLVRQVVTTQEQRIACLEAQVKQLLGMGGAVDEFKAHIEKRFGEGG